MTTNITTTLALLEQLVGALEFEASLYTRNSEDGLPYHLLEVITAGRAALANAEPARNVTKVEDAVLRGALLLSGKVVRTEMKNTYMKKSAL